MGRSRHPVLAAALVLVMALAGGAQASAGATRPTTATTAAATVAVSTADVAATATAMAQRMASPRTLAIQQVINFALAQLGKGYAFNTAGPTTFDCSGLTMAAYAVIGVYLPHQSAAQAQYGTAVDWRTQAIEPGDLIMTDGSTGTGVISHVALALNATTIVHATRPGDVVRVAPMPTNIIAVRRMLPD